MPRPIFFKPLGTVTYSKRTWTIAFDDSQRMSSLVPSLPSSLVIRKPIVAKRPVARALFGSFSDEVLSANDNAVSDFAGTGEMHPEDVVSGGLEEISSSSVVFSSAQVKDKKQTRRKKPMALWWILLLEDVQEARQNLMGLNLSVLSSFLSSPPRGVQGPSPSLRRPSPSLKMLVLLPAPLKMLLRPSRSMCCKQSERSWRSTLTFCPRRSLWLIPRMIPPPVVFKCCLLSLSVGVASLLNLLSFCYL